MLRRGVDPFGMTLRQMISITQAWFLSFFEPAQWTEVEERLHSAATAVATVETKEGAGITVSQQHFDQMADLLQGVAPSPPEEPPEEPSDDSEAMTP